METGLILLICILTGAAMAWFMWSKIHPASPKNAVQAMADILTVRQTGMLINNNPEVKFKLQFKTPSGQIVIAEAKCIVSLIQIPQVQPGQTVRVLYDPNNVQDVVIDHL